MRLAFLTAAALAVKISDIGVIDPQDTATWPKHDVVGSPFTQAELQAHDEKYYYQNEAKSDTPIPLYRNDISAGAYTQFMIDSAMEQRKALRESQKEANEEQEEKWAKLQEELKKGEEEIKRRAEAVVPKYVPVK